MLQKKIITPRWFTGALCTCLMLASPCFAQSPGGVNTNLKLWLKANAGVTGTTTVTAWADQSGLGNNAATAGTASGTAPALSAASMNFNPAVTFSISSPSTNYKYLKTTANPATANMSLIAVYKTTQNAGGSNFNNSPALLGGEKNGVTTDYGLGFNAGKVAVKANAAYSYTWLLGLGSCGSYGGNDWEAVNTATTIDNVPRVATGTRAVSSGTESTLCGTIPQENGAVSLYANGALVSSAASRGNASLTGASAGLGIGNHADPEDVSQFSGDIAEAIVYDKLLTATERQKVETYLAIKYGITLTNNYLAADGTSIFSVSGYGNNIAGIGRDDNAGLNQKQSQSVNNGSQIAMSLGTVAASNSANANTFSANSNYLVWGDDGGTGNTSVLGLAGVSTRVNRWYKLQNTGIAKTANVYVPVSFFASNLSHFLIMNSTASVNVATTTLIPSAVTTINGVSYYSVSITWAAGATVYFTFGEPYNAPGGVPGATTWLRADAGTNTTTNGAAVSLWTNQMSANGQVPNVSQANANRQPTYKTKVWNFNPGIYFDGNTGSNGDVLANLAIGDVSNVFGTNNNNEFFGVFNIEATTGSSTADPVYFQVSEAGTGGPKWSLEGNDMLYPVYNNRALPGTVPISLSSTLPNIANAYTVPGTASYTVDGATPVSNTYSGSFAASTTNPRMMVGGFVLTLSGSTTYDYFMKGNFTEIVTFGGKALTATEKQKVASYLALKYGKTLPGDYLSTTNVTTYQVMGYGNNIAGIGRDDSTILYQKQSQSINAGNQLLMSIGAPAATNQLNGSMIAADRQFLVWGDNGGTEAFVSETNGPVAQRMNKWFRAQNTAFGETVKVMYPAAAFSGYNAVFLLTGNAATTVDATSTAMTLTTVDGVSYYTADFTFGTNTTTYFTFGVAKNVYYVRTGTANIADPANWTPSETGGAGTSPANFVTPGNLFIINNSVGGSNTATLASTMTISGTDAKMYISTANTGMPSISISETGSLIVGAGATVDFGGKNVAIRSTASGTGSIGRITGQLNNATNITIERYLAAGRKWHLLTAPISSGQTIYNSWQEGGVNTNTGYGTYITNGTQYGGGGYDAAPWDAYMPDLTSSLRVFSGAANGMLTTPANTNVAISSYPAYFLFVRGDRTPASYSAYQAQPTTLRINGTMIQGNTDQALSAAGTGFDVLKNPYPCPISLASALNPPATIYLWDPNYGQYFGGYITYTLRGTPGSYTYTTSATEPTFGTTLTTIQSGQAFLAARGGAATFTIGEAQKTTSLLNLLKTTSLPGGVSSGIVVRVKSNEGSVLKERDVTDTWFAEGYSNTMVYGEDAPKSGNFGENISFYRSGEWLAIEKRKMPTATDTLIVQLWKTSAIPYTFQIEAAGLPPGIQPILIDYYANTQTPLNTSGVINYTFTSNGNNVDLNRFKIVFTNAVTLPVTITNVSAYRQNGAVIVDWSVLNEDGIAGYEAERAADGITFHTIGTARATNELFEHHYTATDSKPAAGATYYRIKSLGVNGLVKYSRTVKIDLGSGSPVVTLYPIPVTGNTLSLGLASLPEGSYTLSLYSAGGKQVTAKQVNISRTGTMIQIIDLPDGRPAGSYLLRVEGSKFSYSGKITVQ